MQDHSKHRRIIIGLFRRRFSSIETDASKQPQYDTCRKLRVQKTGIGLSLSRSLSNNPCFASSKTGVIRTLSENKREYVQNKAVMSIPPAPFCKLFQVHRSKSKLHPVSNLSQACVSCIAQSMLLLCIRKDTLYRFFSRLVHPFIDRGMSDVLSQFFVILPDMPRYYLDTFFTPCA